MKRRKQKLQFFSLSLISSFFNIINWSINCVGNFRELCDIIAKSDEVLQRNSAHLTTVLETLDIQQHSLGFLAVLVAKFSLPHVSTYAVCTHFVLWLYGVKL